MILSGKQLFELEEARDKFTLDFAKWLNKNNKIVMDEFSIKELLEIFKEEKIKPLLKQ